MEMEVIAAKIAVLENQQAEARAERVAIRQDQKDIKDAIDRMEGELTRYRGFWGGVVLIISAILTFLKFYWESVANFVKGTG